MLPSSICRKHSTAQAQLITPEKTVKLQYARADDQSAKAQGSRQGGREPGYRHSFCCIKIRTETGIEFFAPAYKENEQQQKKKELLVLFQAASLHLQIVDLSVRSTRMFFV